MSVEATAVVLAWVAIVMLAFAMAGMLRQLKTLTELVGSRSGPAPGSQRGQRIPDELLAGLTSNGSQREQILAFMDQNCPGCTAIAPALERLAAEGAVDVHLVFRDKAKGVPSGRVSVLEGMGSAFDRLQIPATPFALRISNGGNITDAAAIGSTDRLRAFIDHDTQKEVTT